MSFQDTLEKLGDTTARSLLSVLEQLTGGDLDELTARELMSIVLELAGNQATSLGSLAYSAHAEVATGHVKAVSNAALIVPAEPTPERIGKALATIFAGDPEQLATRLERLGVSDPVNVALEAFGQAMREDERVEGWTRQVERDACELCNYWDDNGRMYARDHEMPTHVGCVCSQQPAFKK